MIVFGILLAILAFVVATGFFFVVFFVGLAWWAFIIAVSTASGGIVPIVVGMIYLIVFAVPQWALPGSWIAEKAHNGAGHLTDFIFYLFLLPFHAFGYAIDLFRWFLY